MHTYMHTYIHRRKSVSSYMYRSSIIITTVFQILPQALTRSVCERASEREREKRERERERERRVRESERDRCLSVVYIRCSHESRQLQLA